jgi:cell fate regulator YaaT (PSP1 superfamily)
MKLLTAHYAFDESVLTFYFSAEGRIDFRRLVKELASIFKVRIEMHQVGPRDEARLFSGFGPCGQPLCCARFLSVFDSITIKMAKEQGVSLTPGKISGTCGRLQCCLRFEYDFYRSEKQKVPKIGTKFEADGCQCRVVDCNLLAGKVAIEKEGSGKCWLSLEEASALCSKKES